jgi:hypothetical protein
VSTPPRPGFVVSGRCEPPTVFAAEAEFETTVLLEVRCGDVASTPAEPRSLLLVCVGGPSSPDPELLGAALERQGSAGTGSARLEVLAGPTEARAPATQGLFAQPFPTLSGALEALAERMSSMPPAQRPVLVVRGPTAENADAVLRAVQRLEQTGRGVDVLAASVLVDAGLAARIAQVDGGVFAVVDGIEPLVGAIELRRRSWHETVSASARLELEVAGGVTPLRAFRLDPVPAFLGPIRLPSSGDRRVSLPVGPIAAGRSVRFLVTFTAVRRRLGRYRVLEARLRNAGEVTVEPRTLSVVQTCTDDPGATWVEAEVTAARDVVELGAWIDDVVRAFSEADHRRVATTLDRIGRRFVELGRPADGVFTSEVRSRYLRGGIIERRDLNRLRSLAIG